MNRLVVESLVALTTQLRPDLPSVIVTSLVVEAIDRAAEPTIDELEPQRRWTAIRQDMYAQYKRRRRRAA